MNSDRYVRITENVYIDRWGGRPPQSSFNWIEAVVVLVILGVLAAILMPAFMRTHSYESGWQCQCNLKQVGLGLMQYTQDNDDKYPPIQGADRDSIVVGSEAAYGWADAIQPYIKTTELYHCPLKQANATANNDPEMQPPAIANPVAPGYTDYWLNENLGGVATGKLLQPALTFLAGEGNTGFDDTTARYSLRGLPATWRSNHAAPAWRHHNRANYLFTDGHVKSFAATVATEDTFNRAAFSLQGLTMSQLEP